MGVEMAGGVAHAADVHRIGCIAERLESRWLLSGFEAHINFQPVAAPSPAGYVADNGDVFGDRGNGFSYGWNGKKPAKVYVRHGRRAVGPDERYNTFAMLNRRGRGSVWQIAVPDGVYDVHIVGGDPFTSSGRYRITADGVLVVNGRATHANRWVEGTQQMTVTGGMLSITAGPGVQSDRIDFIDISQVVLPTTMPPPPDPNPPPPNPTPTPPPPQSNVLDWKTVASSPVALLEAQSAVANGKLYVFGGYNVDSPNFLATTQADSYDPATNTWTRLADMPEPLTHIGVATDGQFIYLAGGYVTSYKTGYQTFGTRDVWRYDIAHNTWSAFVPLPAPRAAGAMVLLGRALHYFDGVDPTRAGHADHWVLNLDDPSPKWVALAPLPASRNHITGTVLDGKIYAIGGQPNTNDATPSADLFMWDPAHPNAWTALASMPEPRSHAVTAVVNGRIIVVGGATTGDVALSSVIAYDPLTNTWASLTPVPSPRLAPAGGYVDGRLIVTTGDDQGLRAQTWSAAT
ncbi:MAG: hypothetical protein JWN24_4861 [Phycisphaerales bacterium]|nr:hypothetical protein [Phycisphaerales bacterium]